MFKLIWPLIKGSVPNMIRHGATAAGSALATNGWATADEASTLTGALIVIGTLAWSVAERRGFLKVLGL